MMGCVIHNTPMSNLGKKTMDLHAILFGLIGIVQYHMGVRYQENDYWILPKANYRGHASLVPISLYNLARPKGKRANKIEGLSFKHI